jgi:RNA polymerase sigma-70 factor (ECF subfamily)
VIPPKADNWTTLYGELAPSLKHYFLSRPETRNDADDMVQEVFAAAWKFRSRYDENELPKVMLGIARNCWRRQCRTGVRRQRKLTAYEQFLEVNDTATKWSRLEPLLETLARTIRRLPRKQAAAVRLRYYERYSICEISGRLSLSESAVNCLLYRARRRLRWMLHAEPNNLPNFSVGEGC